MSVQPTYQLPDDVDVIELIADPVIAFDAQRRIVQWNRAAEQTYGYVRREALGQHVAELLRMRFPLPVSELRDTLADTGFWRGDVVALTSDGRELSVESSVVAERDEYRNVTGGVAVHRDITARQRGEHALERGEAVAARERLRGRLHRTQRLDSMRQVAGGIAHDFNNLLAIIINYAALITGELGAMERAPKPECWAALRADVAEIQTAAERGAGLTQQLLSFARQEAGNPQPIDLNAAVRGVEELLRRAIGDQIDLGISLSDDLGVVQMDEGLAEQLVLNLVVNSLDAMPGGGMLTIDTAMVDVDDVYVAQHPELAPGPHVRLRVSDTGTGMAPEELEHAFEPFFTTKRPDRGTGLGLAAVRSVIDRAGGDARLYSQPGIGTTFVALFPMAEAEGASTAPPACDAVFESSTARTVLLVEDEEAVREVTRRILVKAGWRVIGAGAGREALEAASKADGEIDLLLSDVVMPGMLGPQLAATLRAQRPSLRVLYMSGFAAPVLDHAFAIEGADVIEKPFTAPQLLERIAAQVAPA
jgi:two-component system, cell cycle sensor histidine kinase and response regulator CckA